MEQLLRRLSILGTIGMFLVLLMGATVTDTGSQTGCGRSWPLCHGNFLPASVRESVIEFSHRAVTGVIGIVIIALAVLSIRIRHKYPALLPLVPIMVGALLVQSGMGAWAVKYPQSAAVLALHFGFSLVAVAGVFLVMRVIDEQSNGRYGEKPPAPPILKALFWMSVVVVYVVAYSGAYIKHAKAEDGCRSWPLCDGQVWPGLSGDNGVIFMHRLAATGSVLLMIGIAVLPTGIARSAGPVQHCPAGRAGGRLPGGGRRDRCGDEYAADLYAAACRPDGGALPGPLRRMPPDHPPARAEPGLVPQPAAGARRRRAPIDPIRQVAIYFRADAGEDPAFQCRIGGSRWIPNLPARWTSITTRLSMSRRYCGSKRAQPARIDF